MPLSYTLYPYDEKGEKAKHEKRQQELAECSTIEQKIALKQVWAIEDMKPHKCTNNQTQSNSGISGLFGLLGLLGLRDK